MSASVIARYPPWLVCQCPQGTYYSNEQTGETTWQAPPDVHAAMYQQQQYRNYVAAQQQQYQQQSQMQYPLAGGAPPMYSTPAVQYGGVALGNGSPPAAYQQPHGGGQPNFSSYGGGPSDSVGGSIRRTGTLKKFFEDKGFGFIEGPSGDTFVHFNQVTNGSKQDMVIGIEVEYDVETDHRSGRPRAANVTIVGRK